MGSGSGSPKLTGGWELPVPRTSGDHCEVTPAMSRDAHLHWTTQHVAPPSSYAPKESP